MSIVEHTWTGGSKPSLPMLPPEYQATVPKGTALPDKVAYVVGGGLVPFIPADPDLPRAVTATVSHRAGRAANGLPLRIDAFARLIARGVSGVAAYRACFPSSGEAIRDATRASKMAGTDRVKAAVSRYRAAMEAERSQATFGMRDFVLSRLTHEAQTAPEASARIKALDLLGKSEALWTTVHRTERAVSPTDLAALKAQLELRVRHALTRLGIPRIMDVMENPDTPHLVGSALPGPHPVGDPLVRDGDPPPDGDTISVKSPAIFTGPPPVEMTVLDLYGSLSPDSAGGSPRELLLADLGL